MESSSILSIVMWALPVILAITLHEAAHGYVARMFGDDTAYMLGRVTLNPIKHVDPIGTLLIPGVIVLSNAITGAQFPPFGWAKPVPVNFGRLRRPKQDMLWVAAAGPGINFVQAIAWAVIGGAIVRVSGEASAVPQFLYTMAQYGVIANLGLMLLNLIPLPPLDGGRIMVSLLPHTAAFSS
jgi:Zn-dependent protease